MRKTILITTPLLLLLLITLSSGMYRHDRPIEKYLALATQPQFDCVGQIMLLEDGKWTAAGSFVLIDSLHILSAAHCFTAPIKKDTVVEYHGRKILTYVEQGRYQLGTQVFAFLVHNTIVKAKKINIHPDYIKNGSCDIAFIQLEQPMAGAQIVKLNTARNEVNDTGTGVGFGVSGPASKPELVGVYNIKLAGQNRIDSAGGPALNGISTMLYADFDDGRQEMNKTGAREPLDLEYCIGSGDSGGPLFISKQGNLIVAGIAVYGGKTLKNILTDGYYGELMGWTRISAFSAWINNQMR